MLIISLALCLSVLPCNDAIPYSLTTISVKNLGTPTRAPASSSGTNLEF